MGRIHTASQAFSNEDRSSTKSDPDYNQALEITKQRERALSRMLMTYIVTGLGFMLLPGTFLGVWNLISISSKHASSSVSVAWIQAHGQAQVFGWIGSFILGIGFYSIPKMRRAQPFVMWEAWACWAMWTSAVALRWFAGVYNFHWRTLLPISAATQLLAFLIFLKTVSMHRPANRSREEATRNLDTWIFVVIAGAFGLLSTLVMNLVGAVEAALGGFSPAFSPALDQRLLLVLMAWGFMVPFVWGFSARWLPIFLGLRPPSERGLLLSVALNTIAITLAMLGNMRAGSILFLTAAVESALSLRLVLPPVAPAKVQGVHRSFPHFVRLAYVWLTIAAALGVWAALVPNSDGVWGASRHALTVGFVATMVFAIGQRVLPAFSGMCQLYSPKVMGASLLLLALGCSLRVTSEVLAYQGIAESAWRVLPISAVIELTAVTVFAVNMVATFVTDPPSRLVQIR